jgi:hypothetical protein
MTLEKALLNLLITFVVLGGTFLLLRQIVLWYWKISRIEQLLVEILEELRQARPQG